MKILAPPLASERAVRARPVRLPQSGRILGSDEALRLGLVEEVVTEQPVLDRALACARDVAARRENRLPDYRGLEPER